MEKRMKIKLITIKKNKFFYSTLKKNKSNSNNWSYVLGRKGPKLNAYSLAIQYINEGRPVRAIEINKVLAFSGLSISQKILDKILSSPRLDFFNLNTNTIKTDKFLQTIGTVRGKVQVPGVYIWTHLSTGDKYVGSSSKLAHRLINYFYNTHKNIGKLIPLIKNKV